MRHQSPPHRQFLIQRCSHCLTAVVLLGDLSMVTQPHLQTEQVGGMLGRPAVAKGPGTCYATSGMVFPATLHPHSKLICHILPSPLNTTSHFPEWTEAGPTLVVDPGVIWQQAGPHLHRAALRQSLLHFCPCQVTGSPKRAGLGQPIAPAPLPRPHPL